MICEIVFDSGKFLFFECMYNTINMMESIPYTKDFLKDKDIISNNKILKYVYNIIINKHHLQTNKLLFIDKLLLIDIPNVRQVNEESIDYIMQYIKNFIFNNFQNLDIDFLNLEINSIKKSIEECYDIRNTS